MHDNVIEIGLKLKNERMFSELNAITSKINMSIVIFT